MLHNEHLKKADELYEIRHDDNGNAIHIFIKDGNANIYRTLYDMIQREYLGQNGVEVIQITEDGLTELYGLLGSHYSFDDVKKLYLKMPNKKLSFYVVKEQIQLQHKMKTSGSVNAVICTHCDQVLLHDLSVSAIQCCACDEVMSVSDCRDLWRGGDEYDYQ